MLNSVSPQVLLVLTVWLGTAGLVKEDLRVRPERPGTPERRALQVSQAFVRRQCVWLRQRTPPRDYRRREQLKDPMFRELSLHQQLTTPRREEERRRETTLLSGTTSRTRGGGTILVTGCIAPPPDTERFWRVGHTLDLKSATSPWQQQLISTHIPLNSLVFLDDASVSPIQIFQPCSSSAIGTDIPVYCICLSPTTTVYMSWEELKNQVRWKVLFCYAVVTLMVLHMQYFVWDTFWSFNAVPLLRHHTRCL